MYIYIYLDYPESKYRLRISLAHPRLSLWACAVTSCINWGAPDAISWNSCYVCSRGINTLLLLYYYYCYHCYYTTSTTTTILLGTSVELCPLCYWNEFRKPNHSTICRTDVYPTSIQLQEGEGKEGHYDDKDLLMPTDYTIWRHWPSLSLCFIRHRARPFRLQQQRTVTFPMCRPDICPP